MTCKIGVILRDFGRIEVQPMLPRTSRITAKARGFLNGFVPNILNALRFARAPKNGLSLLEFGRDVSQKAIGNRAVKNRLRKIIMSKIWQFWRSERHKEKAAEPYKFLPLDSKFIRERI